MAVARASNSTGPTGRSDLPGKIDFVEVEPGDSLIFETAGAGGWGNPLLRPLEAVRVDAERGFVSAEAAKSGYGVVLLAVDSGYHVDEDATGRLRHERARTTVPLFDLGSRPDSYTATVENPEIQPLGPEQVIAPRSIDAGLLDSRE